MITLRELFGFARNKSHSIQFVSLYKNMHLSMKSQVLHRKNLFFRYICQFNRAKVTILAKLFEYAELSYFLTEIINYSWHLEVFADNDCFFPKLKTYGTEILDNYVDNSSKTHRIRTKQVPFNIIRFTLQVHTKNMHCHIPRWSRAVTLH